MHRRAFLFLVTLYVGERFSKILTLWSWVFVQKPVNMVPCYARPLLSSMFIETRCGRQCKDIRHSRQRHR
jgi:hypothetical protein